MGTGNGAVIGAGVELKLVGGPLRQLGTRRGTTNEAFSDTVDHLVLSLSRLWLPAPECRFWTWLVDHFSRAAKRLRLRYVTGPGETIDPRHFWGLRPGLKRRLLIPASHGIQPPRPRAPAVAQSGDRSQNCSMMRAGAREPQQRTDAACAVIAFSPSATDRPRVPAAGQAVADAATVSPYGSRRRRTPISRPSGLQGM